MSKTGVTKARILEKIKSKNMTMSEIGEELGLSPSTVCQHLKELRNMGEIEEVENPHIKKWKYYRIKDGTGRQIIASDTMRLGNKHLYYGVAIAALIAGIILANTQYVAILTPISITDPPIVPSGTTSLTVGYSSVSAYIGTPGGGERWISSQSSGSINLMSVLNSSQVIARVNIPPNSSVKEVRLNTTHAYIVINGTTYNVTVPGNKILARVSGNTLVNSSSGVLVDFMPTVTTAYYNGTSKFVMLPSSIAAVTRFGERSRLISEDMFWSRKGLDGAEMEAIGRYRPDLRLANSSISFKNGSVSIYADVINYGNRSVYIDRVALVGVAVQRIRAEGCISGSGRFGGCVFESRSYTGVLFTVGQNGTLAYESNTLFHANNASGYDLEAGKSKAFSAVVPIGTLPGIITGGEYKVAVLGEYNISG